MRAEQCVRPFFSVNKYFSLHGAFHTHLLNPWSDPALGRTAAAVAQGL